MKSSSNAISSSSKDSLDCLPNLLENIVPILIDATKTIANPKQEDKQKPKKGDYLFELTILKFDLLKQPKFTESNNYNKSLNINIHQI